MKSGQGSEFNCNTSRQGIQELTLIPEMFYVSIRTLKKYIHVTFTFEIRS